MTDDDLLDDFDDDDEPDFTALYEPFVDGEGWQMSPRMAWHLWSAARYLADEVRTGQPDALADMLPAVARRYVDRAWRQRFVAAFGHIADRLAAPDGDEYSPVARPRRSLSTSRSTSPLTTGSTTWSVPLR